ncbi:heterokaryon incompatibility [Lasiosphaeria ovina]|uniref:Heterokaryon incompatibility n=1 Tax=Lasiosphaeria ovina TaxID=92902 RepID=A0AAE0JWG8_9PEZI|nr:heterokaryon incompatibility [Lasiosphaeria ovina]
MFDEYQSKGPSPLLDDIAGFAFFDLRRPHIWIDAVCIDQQDDAERIAQVAMMHRVYSAASYVVVWLGKRRPVHRRCYVGPVENELDRWLTSLIAASYHPEPLRRKDYDAAVVPRISQDGWDTLASLFLRQWFCRRRIWIV